LYRLDGTESKNTEVKKEKNVDDHDFKILCNFIAKMNDDRITHVLNGDFQKSFEGIVNILYDYLQYFNLELLTVEENDENKVVFDIAKRVKDIGYPHFCMRVIHMKMYFIAKSVNERTLVDHFKKILDALGSSQHFKNFVLLSASVMASIKGIHVGLADVLLLDENTDLLEFIVHEYKKRFPGSLEHLLELFQPFDELPSEYSDITYKYTSPKNKIEDIKLGHTIDIENDNKSKLIAAETEKLLAEINDCITILENTTAHVYQQLGNVNVYSHLPLQLSNLYSAIRKVDKLN